MAPTSKKKIIDKSNARKRQRAVKRPLVKYFLRSKSKGKSVSNPLETDADPVQVEPVASVSSTTSVTSVEMSFTSNTISLVPENEASIPSSLPSSGSLEYSLEASYPISKPVLHSTLPASVSSTASNETTSVKVTLMPFSYGDVVSASDMASISGDSVGTSSRNRHSFSEKNEDSLCSQPLSSSVSVIEPLTSEPLSSTSVSSTTSVTSVEMASTSNTISLVPENEASVPSSLPSSVSLEYSLESSYQISMPVLHSTLAASVSSTASSETTSVKVTLTPFSYGDVVSASDMASISGDFVGTSSRNRHSFSEKNEDSLCSQPLSSSVSVIEPLTSEPLSSTSVSSTTSVTSVEMASTSNTISLVPENEASVPSSLPSSGSLEYSLESSYQISMPVLHSTLPASVSSTASNETTSVKVTLTPFSYGDVVSASDMASISGDSVGTSSRNRHSFSEKNEDSLCSQPLSSSVSVIEPLTSEPLSSTSVSSTSVTSVEMASTSNTISLVPENEASVPSSLPSSGSLEYSLESSYQISMPVLHSTLPASVSSTASNETTSVKVTLTPFSYGDVVSASDMASISGDSVGTSSRNRHSFSEKNEDSLCSQPLSSSMSVIEPLSFTSVSPTESLTIESSVSTGNNASCAKLLTVNSESSASVSKLPINKCSKAKLSTAKVKSSYVKTKSSIKTRSSSIKTCSSTVKKKLNNASVKKSSHRSKPFSSSKLSQRCITNKSDSPMSASLKGKSIMGSIKLPVVSEQPIPSTSKMPSNLPSEIKPCALKGKSIIGSNKLPAVSEKLIPSTSKLPSNLSSEIKPSALKGKSTNYNNKLHTSGDQSIASVSELPMDKSSKTESSTSNSKQAISPNKTETVSCTSVASISNSKTNSCGTESPVVTDQPIPSTSKVSSDSAIEASSSRRQSNNYRAGLYLSHQNYLDLLYDIINISTPHSTSNSYRAFRSQEVRVSDSKSIASVFGDTDSSTSSSSETESTSSETNIPSKPKNCSQKDSPAHPVEPSTSSETNIPSKPKNCSQKVSPARPVEPWVIDFFRPHGMETRMEYTSRVSINPPVEPLPPPSTRLFKLLQGRELGQISNYHFPQNLMHTRITNYSKKVSYGFMNEDIAHSVYFLRGGHSALVAVWWLHSSRKLPARAVGQISYDMTQNSPGRITYITTSRMIKDACQISSESFACIGNDYQDVGVLQIATRGSLDNNPYALSEFPHIRGNGYLFNCCNSNGLTEEVAVGCDKELFFYSAYGMRKHLIVNDNIFGLAFNQAGNFLYYTCDNGEMVTYNMVTEVMGHRAKIANDMINEVLVLGDENYCIVSGPSGCLCRVDNRMNQVVLRYPGHYSLGSKIPLSVHNKFNLLSCTGPDDVTRVWCLGTGRPLFSFRGPTTYSCRSCLVPRSQKGSIYLVQDDVINIYSTLK